MNKLLTWISLNIHTILLLVGIGFISVSAFLCSEIVGYLVLGIGCVAVSVLISKGRG